MDSCLGNFSVVSLFLQTAISNEAMKQVFHVPPSHLPSLPMVETVIPTTWPDRYYHVDQVLDRPGPRTDDSFAAGSAVRD